MAYQLTSLNVSASALPITDAGAEALQQRVAEFVAVPVHEFPQFAAPADIDILGDDAAAATVDDRVGAPKAEVAEIVALRDVSVVPAGDLAAFDHLLATMRTELSRLQGFAGATRSGRPRGQQTDGVAI